MSLCLLMLPKELHSCTNDLFRTSAQLLFLDCTRQLRDFNCKEGQVRNNVVLKVLDTVKINLKHIITVSWGSAFLFFFQYARFKWLFALPFCWSVNYSKTLMQYCEPISWTFWYQIPIYVPVLMVPICLLQTCCNPLRVNIILRLVSSWFGFATQNPIQSNWRPGTEPIYTFSA